MEKPNRAERRKNKFGGGRTTEQGGWPTHLPNPVFTGDAPAEDEPPAKPTARKSAAGPTKGDDSPADEAPAKAKPAKG